MSDVTKVTNSVKATVTATPNNYGVTHIGIDGIPDTLLWTTAKLIRKYTGYPQNIYDGDTLYSITNDNYIVKVASLYDGNPISGITYAGGSVVSVSESTDFITYTAAAGTGGTGNGATFDVVRSGPAASGNGSVISVRVNCAGESYAADDTLTIVGSLIGGTDGTHDVTVTVRSVDSNPSNGVKTVTLVESGYLPSATKSNVLGASSPTCSGVRASFTVTDSGTVSVYSGGGGYSVGDYISIPSSLLGGASVTTQPNEYGLTAKYHLYDVYGEETIRTTNPVKTSSTVYGQVGAPTRAYYSLFIEYVVNPESLTPKSYYWKLGDQASAQLVADSGMLDTLVAHLPAFYINGSQNGDTNDLVDFLSLFAFQLELYKKSSSNVFRMSDVSTADEELVKSLLVQLGGNYNDVNDVAQARSLINNLVYTYQESGSLGGVQTLIESYTGYNSRITTGRNILANYDSASFEDSTGLWNVAPGQTYVPILTNIGPVEHQSAVSTSDIATYTDSAYAYPYGKGLTMYASGATATGSTKIKVSDTTGLKVGSALTSGTSLYAGTVVTAIVASTSTIIINRATAATISDGAAIKASTNLIAGMAKLTTATTSVGTAAITLGVKKSTLLATAASGTKTLVVSTNATPAVNEYIVCDGVPANTYVVSKTTVSTNSTLTLSKKTTASIANGTTIWSSRATSDKIGAQHAWLRVNEQEPYAFSAYLNRNSVAATSVVTPSITWYDRKGSVLSTTTGSTGTYAANELGWYPVKILDIAPTNAFFAEPKLSATGISSSQPIYIDAVQFESGVNIVTKQVVAYNGSTHTAEVKVTTASAHNFTGNDITSRGGSGTSYVAVKGLGAPYDSTTSTASYAILNNSNLTDSTFSYVITSTAISGTDASPVAAYNAKAASNTPFEDVRVTEVQVLADRINLVTNPSFETAMSQGITPVNTHFWTNTNSTAVATTSQSVSGGYSLKVTASSAADVVVTGHAGSVTASTGAIVSTSTTSMTLPDTNGDYTLSMWVKPTTNARNVVLAINFTTGTVSTTISSANVPANTWTRVSVTGTVPVGSTDANVSITFKNAATSDIFYIDDVLFEYGSDLLFYFDGDFDGQNYASNGIAIDSTWELGGIANACRSHYYYNRIGNTGRLKTVITDGLYYA